MTHDHIEQLARRRAGMKLGFFIHLAVYLLVNGALALLALSQGRGWAAYPALGWGVGLAVHGAVTFMLSSGAVERLVQRERERLVLQRDPW